MPVSINYFSVNGFVFPWVIGGSDGSASSSRRLERSPAEVVQQLLVNHSIGTLGGLGGEWPIFATSEPDTPDDCITVYDTNGGDDGRHMVDGEMQGLAGINIRIRSSGHRAGHDKANQIAVEIAQAVRLEHVTVADETYLVWGFSRTSGPTFVGKDTPASKRSVFTINTLASVRTVN